ncbi:hypothetical protein AX774_g4787 [Zancudomyces culisetae]|uniref:Uncharacterized protein n=1 Tax=Zancudomyces culisetae TaxID=1213189 RepID=A0A1R1PL98_ZANCU|nr:hypothetical protein AX774_g4787 [Zancudomyces culisetae]|eukprot:OMH81751.1 hypothetical protein AX774_g4787 [Zancudomyces culisetae]
MNNTDRRHRAGGAGFIAEVFNASIYLIGEYCQLLTHSTQIEQLVKDILDARFLANHKEAGIDYVVTFKALVKLYVELFCRFESIVEDGGYDEELIETRREQLGEIVTFGIASVEKVKTYRDSSKYSDFGLLQSVLVSIRKSISTNPGSVDSVWNGLVKKSSQLSTPIPKIDSPTSLPDGELCLSASLLKSFINSYELNPIAPTAQSRVEIPEGLRPILDTALVDSELLSIPDTKHALINAFEIFENSNVGEIPSSNLGPGNTDDNSNKRHQRSIKPAKGVDTRFYIKRSDANKHKSDALSNGQNSEEIPIMPLELNKESSTTNSLNQPHLDKGLTFEKSEHVEIIHDENLLDHTENDNASSNPTSLSKSTDSPATLLQPQKSHNTAISSSAPPLSQPKGYTQQVLLKQGGIRLKLLDQVVKDPQSRQPISTKKLHHPSPHLETVEVLSVLKFKLKPKLFSTFNRLAINCVDDFILNNTNQFGIPILPLVINLDTFKASGQPVVDKSVIHISEDKCGFSVLFPILVHQSVFKVFSSPIPQTSPRGDNSVDASNSAAVPVVAVSIVIELSNEAANDDARFSSNKLVVYCSLPILT